MVAIHILEDNQQFNQSTFFCPMSMKLLEVKVGVGHIDARRQPDTVSTNLLHFVPSMVESQVSNFTEVVQASGDAQNNK